MAAAARVRRASVDALAEIEPAELANQLQAIVTDASMVPGMVTILTAETGAEPAARAALERGVGVQLCYEGLRVTRELIRDDSRYRDGDATHGYLELVGAEVLVSRGFANLARTEVAPQTIDIVQRFSRNQTHAYDGTITDAPDAARTLEYDVIELAVAAGAELVYEEVPATIDDLGRQLATEFDRQPLPGAAGVASRIRADLAAATPASDAVTVND